MNTVAAKGHESKPDSGQDRTNDLPKTPEPVPTMQFDLFRLGYERGRKSGAVEPREEDVAALKEHAAAIARETYRELYDPARHPHDELRHQEYVRKLADRDEAKLARKHAAEELRDKEEEAAKAKHESEKPQASGVLKAAGVIATAITVAPTLHDFIFVDWNDDMTAWSLSMLFGAFIGVLITWTILTISDRQESKTLTNWAGLIGGVILSLGLLAVRLSGAEGLGETAFAVGLSLAEVGIIVLLEKTAGALREAKDTWASRRVAYEQAGALRDVARGEFVKRSEQLEQIEKWISAHHAYVEERSDRHFNVTDIMASAEKSVLDGYNDGLAANRGRLVGVRHQNANK